jgi:hypothetical protein
MLNKLGLYHESYPREFSYDLPDFDPAHFWNGGTRNYLSGLEGSSYIEVYAY